MSTGNVESFAGKINEIGPMYPFVGWECFLVVLGIIFWIGWHIWQFRFEIREYDEELKKYVNKEILSRVFEREEQDPGV